MKSEWLSRVSAEYDPLFIVWWKIATCGVLLTTEHFSILFGYYRYFDIENFTLDIIMSDFAITMPPLVSSPQPQMGRMDVAVNLTRYVETCSVPDCPQCSASKHGG